MYSTQSAEPLKARAKQDPRRLALPVRIVQTHGASLQELVAQANSIKPKRETGDVTTAWGLEVAEHADSGEIVPFCSAADPFHYKGRRNRHCETLLSLAEIAIKITPGLTPFSPSIKLGGTAPRASCFQTTSCRHAHSTANKTSGGSCGRTGCQTNSLTTSQIIAATRGRP